MERVEAAVAQSRGVNSPNGTDFNRAPSHQGAHWLPGAAASAQDPAHLWSRLDHEADAEKVSYVTSANIDFSMSEKSGKSLPCCFSVSIIKF